ncbi:MAG: F0F1 ATP synthase subunit B [Chitinivibrionales bacterium]
MDLSLKLVLYQAVNFIVLMIILGYLFNRFLRPFMHKRAEEIKKSFESIESQKKDLDVLKQNYTDQVKDIKEKAKLEIEKALEEGNRMREDIVAQAEKESVTIIEKAKKEIDHEKDKAVMEIQKEVATLAIMAAKQVIKKQMDETTNRALVEDFLMEITKNPPKQK